jgi:hypothetical protein
VVGRADGKTLLCDGVGVKEMFPRAGARRRHLSRRVLSREGRQGYNSGVYVHVRRRQALAPAQVAHQEKPPHWGISLARRW